MTKDLLIGFTSKYEYPQLQYWVNSIKASGFSGDVVLITDNISKKTIDALTAKEIELVVYGKKNDAGDYVAEQSIAPHVNRFFYIWNALKTTKNDYRFVITTDTRDVVFQRNPSVWLEENLMFYNLVASSEGMRYENEPWGNNNLLQAFGPFYHNKLKNNFIYNVGVLAGDQDHMTGLMSLIFQLSINRPIPIVDQAVYNYILHTEPFDKDNFFSTNKDNWAIQLGTTIHAVQTGAGDIGQLYMNSPNGLEEYRKVYEDIPVTIEGAKVLGVDRTPYAIVHQYDRVPELKTQIHNLYGENDATEPRRIFHHPV